MGRLEGCDVGVLVGEEEGGWTGEDDGVDVGDGVTFVSVGPFVVVGGAMMGAFVFETSNREKNMHLPTPKPKRERKERQREEPPPRLWFFRKACEEARTIP